MQIMFQNFSTMNTVFLNLLEFSEHLLEEIKLCGHIICNASGGKFVKFHSKLICQRLRKTAVKLIVCIYIKPGVLKP